MIFSFHITTLGCKVNQYESQALREAWLALGWRETLRPASADVLVVNSCAVTAAAVADVRAAVRRLHSEAPLAKIIITGCSAQVVADQMSILPGVFALIANDQKELFAQKPQLFLPTAPKTKKPAPLGKALPGSLPRPLVTPLSGPLPAPFPHPQKIKINPPAFPALAISNYTRARPVLKVQDGCSHGCSYCIVPLARGPARSRPPKEVLAELERLLEADFKEITLSGINLNQYSAEPPDNKNAFERENFDFWALLAFLETNLAEKWQGKARLRLSSLEPAQLDARALRLFAQSRLICPHLHISLQSGSPGVLGRMGRAHYDPAFVVDFCAALRKIWPFFALGADFLMGFPGESAAEFEETFSLVKALPLTYAHVFPFSPRPGTEAASMENQVPKELRAERAAIIRNLVEAKKEAFLQTLCENFATQPLHMILENDPAFANAEGNTGLNEYYVECLLPKTPSWAKNRDCLAVRPLKAHGGKLLVEPWAAR